MLTLKWGAATDVGRSRTLNEDRFVAKGRLFAVADGMGGHAAGEVASELAISEVSSLAGRTELHPDDLSAAISAAHDHIVAAGSARRDRYGMGTTLTGLALVSAGGKTQWAVFNVGDSRVYRWSDGTLRQLTTDHSEVEVLIAAGYLRREQARNYPRRNVVTRALGSETEPEADIRLVPAVDGDRFLVCSDGLTGEIDDAELALLLAVDTDPQLVADELVRRANEYGGHDNITVIVLDVISHSTV